MWIEIHAGLLIALPVATLVVIVVLKRRSPTGRQAAVAVLISLFAMFVVSSVNHHMCGEGTPRNQWLIGGLSMVMVLALLKSAVWRRIIAAILFIGMAKLSCHFTDVVHQPGWTGNPAWDPGAAVARGRLHDVIDKAIQDLDDPQLEYAAGWLRELPVWSDIEARFGDEYQPPARRDVQWVWHTWLTGLYRYRTVDVDYWYPGGPFAEAAPKTELRDRPRQ